MKLSDYIDIYQLLRLQPASAEQNRLFGLEHKGQSTLRQLKAWRDKYIQRLGPDRLSSTYCSYLHRVDLILSIIALIAGMGTAGLLLSYSGKEPVNVIYFLFVAVLLPLLSMVLALWSMALIGKKSNTPVYLSPANWLGKLLDSFGSREDTKKHISLEPSIFNWLIIKRAQMLSFWFSAGVLVSLLTVVATRDIAFGWSTTLHIEAGSFHSILEAIAAPWKSLFPSAVPSAELVRQSQYFRLGGKIGGDMVQNAAMLGEWWKFLAVATLFYAVILRLVLWIVASFGLRSTLRKSMMRLDGVSHLLKQMNTPVVSTVSSEHETRFEKSDGDYARMIAKLESKYQMIIGWSIKEETISLINDSLGISAEIMESAGGANTIEEDKKIISKCSNEVLLYVKAWEPPTMDFVDFVTELAKNADRVIVYPVGLRDDSYKADQKDIAVWERKLARVDGRNVWMLGSN